LLFFAAVPSQLKLRAFIVSERCAFYILFQAENKRWIEFILQGNVSKKFANSHTLITKRKIIFSENLSNL
jgi:hypothetical protein